MEMEPRAESIVLDQAEISPFGSRIWSVHQFGKRSRWCAWSAEAESL